MGSQQLPVLHLHVATVTPRCRDEVTNEHTRTLLEWTSSFQSGLIATRLFV